MRLFSQKLLQEAASVKSTFDACVSKFSDRTADQKVKEKKKTTFWFFAAEKTKSEQEGKKPQIGFSSPQSVQSFVCLLS